jgi:Uma2 family endonuclease
MIELAHRKITVEEFREMEFSENDPFIYELIEGILMKRQAPTPLHQQAVIKIAHAFETIVQSHSNGFAYTSPIDVYLDKYNNTQPDVLFITKERDFIIDPQQGITGAPDLIVEVLSPSTAKVDKVFKKALYLKFGVKEYWIVDPIYKSILVYVLNNDQYDLKQELFEDGKIESSILIDLDLDIKNIFI